LPRNKSAIKAAIKKCNPMNGRNDAATPLATPMAIEPDVPGNLTTR
jgi:hypothetical protein